MTEIFESMHDLHFLRDSLEGADFVLDLLRDKIPTKVSLVHLYDINAKQFVVVKGRAPSVAILGARTPEGTALIGAAVKSGRGILIADAAHDDRWARERYELTGVVPSSICIAPVRQGQRFLGALEIADHHDGQPLGEAELHALTYIAEQYGEFVADRGVKLVSTDSGGYQQLDVNKR
jgi:GAF domain-containing protein